MLRWLRGGAVAAALLGLVALAYGPLLGGGHGAEDLRLLVRAAGGGETGSARAEVARLGSLSLEELHGIDATGSLLANLSLAVLARQVSWERPDDVARVFRIEGVLLLLLAGWGIGLFVRRLLLPWTGSEHAAAAGLATVLLVVVHPLAPALVASLAGRDELLALATASFAAALFLKGRQDRAVAATVAAAGLSVLAGFAGELALYLPFVLTLAELTSAHRYRHRRERLRTAVNTLLAFGLFTSIHLFVRAGGAPLGEAPVLAEGLSGFGNLGEVVTRLGYTLEKVGVLVLPVNTHAMGILGTVLAGVVFLMAVQPALVAARSAPRLWGWLLSLWFAGLFCASLYGWERRVSSDDHTDARFLVGCTALMAVGLGLSCTALSGFRRRALPWATALVYALLAHGNAVPWREAAGEVAELRGDLIATRELYGGDAPLLVLDPPVLHRGVDPLGDALPVLVHPLLGGTSTGGPAVSVRGLSERAFLALVREPEFEAWRREPLVVVFPRALLGPNSAEPLRRGGTRQAVRLPPPEPSGSKRSWGPEPRSPDLDLEALTTCWIRGEARPATDTTQALQIGWRATETLARGSQEACVWVEGHEAPVLVADLGASLPWLLSGRIRRVWFEGGYTRARFVAEDGPLELGEDLEPAMVDDVHWLFGRPEVAGVEAARSRGRFVLGLLDLEHLVYEELSVEELGPDHLRVPGAATRVAEMGQPVAWYLDFRVGDVTIGRARGRRIGRGGTVEAVR